MFNVHGTAGVMTNFIGYQSYEAVYSAISVGQTTWINDHDEQELQLYC